MILILRSFHYTSSPTHPHPHPFYITPFHLPISIILALLLWASSWDCEHLPINPSTILTCKEGDYPRYILRHRTSSQRTVTCHEALDFLCWPLWRSTLWVVSRVLSGVKGMWSNIPEILGSQWSRGSALMGIKGYTRVCSACREVS